MNIKKILALTGETSALLAFLGILIFFLGLSLDNDILSWISMVIFAALILLGTHYVFRTYGVLKEGKVSKWSFYTSLIMSLFALFMIIAYFVWF